MHLTNHPLRTALALTISIGAIAPAGASALPVRESNAPTQPAVQIVSSPAHNGFDWADAGIGAAGGVGVAMLATGGGLALVKGRRSRAYATPR
jgi:hypothetical protein